MTAYSSFSLISWLGLSVILLTNLVASESKAQAVVPRGQSVPQLQLTLWSLCVLRDGSTILSFSLLPLSLLFKVNFG